MSVDMAEIQAQTAEIINKTNQVIGGITDVEHSLQEAVAMLHPLSETPVQMISVATGSFENARGSLLAVVESLQTYRARLNPNR